MHEDNEYESLKDPAQERRVAHIRERFAEELSNTARVSIYTDTEGQIQFLITLSKMSDEAATYAMKEYRRILKEEGFSDY